MIPNGLHYSMMMQMARMGGHKSGRRIEPGKIDGYIQALRDNAEAESKVEKQPAPKKDQSVWVPKVKAGGSDSAANLTTLSVMDQTPEWMARKCGSDRYFHPAEAGNNAVLRANELEQELDVESTTKDIAELPKKRLQWSAGRQVEPPQASS